MSRDEYKTQLETLYHKAIDANDLHLAFNILQLLRELG